MAIISVKSLLEAGVHFGHRISRWNPKMAPYIFAKRNLIHIINLKETVKGLIQAYYFLKRITADGHEVLFVGTKRQAKSVIKKEALRANMHYVIERWLGGTLTNFETIRKRLSRLEDLEKKEQEGSMESLSKKLASALRREKKKIFRNLEGIRNMSKLPSAIVIIDPQKEYIVVKEAAKLNIPTICLMDTDSDPDLIDIPIPGNDDAMRSIEVITNKLATAVLEGRAQWKEKQEIESRKREEERANSQLAEKNEPKRSFLKTPQEELEESRKEKIKAKRGRNVPGGRRDFQNKPRREKDFDKGDGTVEKTEEQKDKARDPKHRNFEKRGPRRFDRHEGEKDKKAPGEPAPAATSSPKEVTPVTPKEETPAKEAPKENPKE